MTCRCRPRPSSSPTPRTPERAQLRTAGVGSAAHLGRLCSTQRSVPTSNWSSSAGARPAMNYLIGGQIDCIVASPPLPCRSSGGTVRPLAVLRAERIDVVPEVPTTAEVGLNNIEAHIWNVLLAPKGTPQPVLDRLTRHPRDDPGSGGARTAGQPASSRRPRPSRRQRRSRPTSRPISTAGCRSSRPRARAPTEDRQADMMTGWHPGLSTMPSARSRSQLTAIGAHRPSEPSRLHHRRRQRASASLSRSPPRPAKAPRLASEPPPR